MPQDRLIELVTKEFIDELTTEEASELKLLIQDKLLKDRYELLKLYLFKNYTDHSSDEAVFKKIQQKIHRQQGSGFQLNKVNRSAFYWKIAVAATLIIVSIITFALYQKDSFVSPSNSSVSQLTYTKRAAKTSITLSDGTRVTLNSDSKLIYPKRFTGDNREVTLIGEAFFDVSKDRHHPFIIHTSKMDVRVLGTAFNVKSYPGDRFSETSLIRGSIEVTLKDRPSDRIILKPSEKLIVSNLSSQKDRKDPRLHNDLLTQVAHIQKNDTTVVETSWVYNKIAFREETFSELSKRLERAYDVQIDFRNEGLKELKFTGTFEKESVASILKALSIVEPFAYKIQDDKITIQ
jgi:transmembrane sensor